MPLFKGATCALTLKVISTSETGLGAAAVHIVKCLSAEGEGLTCRGCNFSHHGGVEVKVPLGEVFKFNWLVWIFTSKLMALLQKQNYFLNLFSEYSTSICNSDDL